MTDTKRPPKVFISYAWEDDINTIITLNKIKDPNALVAGEIIQIPVNLLTATPMPKN